VNDSFGSAVNPQKALDRLSWQGSAWDCWFLFASSVVKPIRRAIRRAIKGINISITPMFTSVRLSPNRWPKFEADR
jgi:hypothetical protein